MTNSRRGRGLWRRGLGAAVGAGAGNLAIYAAGRAADVSFTVPAFDGGAAPVEILAGQVVFVTLVSVGIGTALASFAARDGRVGAVRWLGAIVAVLSLVAPLSLDAGTSTKLLLASMHVVAGASFVITLRRTRAEAPAEGSVSTNALGRAA